MKKLTIIGLPFLLLLFSHCKKEATGIDKEMFDASNTTTGFTFYKNDASYLSKSSASPHEGTHFRVRFNAIAQAALDTSGKLPDGAFFPEGALIVKEIHANGSGSLIQLVTMLKNSSHEDAAGGWLWGEYNPEGTVDYSATKQGAGCTGCHTSNRDYTRIFDIY